MKLSFLKRPLSVFRMSNFAPAFILLPPRRRHALAAVYAFARAVDADEGLEERMVGQFLGFRP